MRRRPKGQPRQSSRLTDDYPERPSSRSAIGAVGSVVNAATLAILAAVFVLGIGLGVVFSSSTSAPVGNISTRYDLDKMAPNSELCVQFGASAMAMDLRAFVTLNPIAVYISQPKVEPGCVMRSSNWALLQQRNLITQQQVNECRSRMNTFGYTGDIERNGAEPKINCIYQNDAAQNLFLNQPGVGAPPPPETNRF